MNERDFVERFEPCLLPITRFVSRRIDRVDVDDIVDDAFGIAWRKGSAVKPGEELPWMYRVASNLIANHRRKRGRENIFLATIRVPDAAPSAESIAVNDISLATAWAKLTASQREVLSLVGIEGLTIHETAVSLGITANAVSVRLNRARTRLREELLKIE